MQLRHSLLAAVVLSVATPAAFAADLTVSGTIVPGACTMTLSNAGVVDLGNVDFTTLNQSAVTNLATKTVSVGIACAAAGRFATEATENRPGTAYTAGVRNFGLGETAGATPIGYYQVGVGNATADAASATAIASTDLTTWAVTGGGVMVEHGAGTKYTSVGTAVAGPATITAATWDLTITPTIAPRDDLVVAGPETIDGSMTLTIVYL